MIARIASLAAPLAMPRDKKEESAGTPPATVGGRAMEAGRQPLDAVMAEAGLGNHDLVASSSEPLTHKEVQKGRKGRRLTRRLQERILRALNARTAPKVFELDEIFNYRGRP
jgi:hypothetical protein